MSVKSWLRLIVVAFVVVTTFLITNAITVFAKNADFESVLGTSSMAKTVVSESEKSASHTSFDFLFFIAVILIAAKISGILEKAKQPAVLGELLAGVMLGNMFILGINWFEPMRHDVIIKVLAELGVIILLFQIGLETNITQMKKVGARAFVVALVGVIVPFLLGTFVAAPLLLPNSEFNTRLFIGAILTATSVGVTARVFKDLGKLGTNEAQIVLGAAVIDDVLGLVILAVVSAVVTTGSVTLPEVFIILGKSVGFLVGSILLGKLIAKNVSKLFSRIHRGTGMKFTITLVFGLMTAYVASLAGLAPIIGAFAAGLVLDQVTFDDFEGADSINEIRALAEKQDGKVKQELDEIIAHHTERHIEYIVAPLGYLFVPVFFVMTGFSVDVRSFLDPGVLLLAAGITLVAFVGKILSGLVAGKVNKLIVGFGMIPRGEVGLIFAVSGKALGVVNDSLYSAIVIMVILSTLLTPLVLPRLMRD